MAKSERSSQDLEKQDTIQSVEVAVQILEAMASHGEPIKLTQLGRLLKMTLPRVSRHLRTLEKSGMIIKSDHSDGFLLGWKLMQLGKAAANQNALIDIARPALTRLSKEIQETVLLSIPANQNAVVVACIESQRLASITLRDGQILRFPISPTARLLFSFRDPTEQKLALSQTDPDLISEFETQKGPLINHTNFMRENFYECDLNPHGSGFASLAAPVFDDRNNSVAAVTIMVPTSRITLPPSTEMLNALFECASSISYNLGSTEMWSKKGFTRNKR